MKKKNEVTTGKVGKLPASFKVQVQHLIYLNETNIKGSLSEALTAHIDVVLSDDGRGVG